MKNVRIWFEKKGTACYISHLDLTRSMSRALKLSRLPVWYTEGYNPRIYMTYAMPLSLGVQGERECMDIRLTEERDYAEIAALLNEKLPRDIRVLHAAEPKRKLEEIVFADYEIFLKPERGENLRKSLEALLARKELPVIRHGKKGDKETDIKPFFEKLEISPHGETGLKLSMRLPCSVSGSVNPGLLLDALRQYEGIEPEAKIVRNRLLTGEFSEIQ